MDLILKTLDEMITKAKIQLSISPNDFYWAGILDGTASIKFFLIYGRLPNSIDELHSIKIDKNNLQ